MPTDNGAKPTEQADRIDAEREMQREFERRMAVWLRNANGRDREAEQLHNEESLVLRSTFDLVALVIRTSVLINGGAIVAILAVIGNLADDVGKGNETAKLVFDAAFNGLPYFLFGTFSAVVGAAFVSIYPPLGAAKYYMSVDEDYKNATGWRRVRKIYLSLNLAICGIGAMLGVGGSIALFGFGAFNSVPRALLKMPW